MNVLHVGFTKSIDLPKGGYLLIDARVRNIPRSGVLDPMKHSFNPLKGIDYKHARELAELFYTIVPRPMRNTPFSGTDKPRAVTPVLGRVRGKMK